MSKVFSTHPLTDDRISTAQKNIATILKEKPEYVLNTSEFNDVKGRLEVLHNRRRVDVKNDGNRPTLRRNPGSGPVDDGSDDKKAPADQDERPTLKRRDN